MALSKIYLNCSDVDGYDCCSSCHDDEERGYRLEHSLEIQPNLHHKESRVEVQRCCGRGTSLELTRNQVAQVVRKKYRSRAGAAVRV